MRIIKRNLPLILLLVCVIILALAPAIQIFFQTKDVWRSVVPEYPADATFYYARMVQVSHGYPFIGNPYIWEYRLAPALSFFVADWLTAVPLLLGASLTVAVLFNVVFWSMLFCFLGYILFLKLELKPWQSAFATALSFTQVYWLMLRPVAMQTVFPSYLLFLLAYLLWFKVPASRKRNIFLAISSAITFYVYTFLWQIVAVSFVLSYLYFLVRRRWDVIRSLVVSNAIAFVLALPMLIYMVKQASNQFYWETLLRVNLVYTRLPIIEVYYYGRWVVLAIILCFIFKLFKSNRLDSNEEGTLFTTVCITGLALLVASWSNLILNKEVDTASHIGRFIVLWFSVVFCTLLVYSWSKIIRDVKISKFIKIAIAGVLFIVFIGYARNSYRAMSYSNVVQTDVASTQSYAIPLDWLNQHAPQNQVVWVLNPKIATYVPVLTHDYLLFHTGAASYLMPSPELVERYMVSHYFDNLSLADIERNYSEYAGPGERAQYQAHNRWVKTCNMFFLNKLGYTCGNIETEISFKGEQYFVELRDVYTHQIITNINAELAKYHVSYLVIDKENDKLKKLPQSIKGLVLVYKDARFEIYKLNHK